MNKIEHFISVVIPNFNGANIIDSCLDYIFSQDYSNFEVIVVDDLSSDDSIEKLKKFKQIKLIKNPKNLGFAASCEIGSKISSGDIILFLNTDAFLIDKTTFSEINNRFEKNKDLNILGFTQLNRDKELDFLGSEIDIFFNINSYNKKDVKKYTMVGGACFATRKEIFNKLGGMDSNYFLYVEEVDYMFRSLKSGYDTEVSEIKVVHLGGESTKNEYNNSTNSNKIYLRERNAFVSILKNFDLTTLIFVIPIWLVFNLLEIAFFVLNFKFEYIKSYLSVYVYILKNLKIIFKKRIFNFKIFKMNDLNLFKSKKVLITNFKISYLYKKGFPKFR